jgi:glycosyltransferase involved in cell wall biosynthesis
MTRSLVTVVIPVHNGERFLAEAIESALGQTHRPVEVIVVDDGSTDGSAAVAESYPEVRLIRAENGGPGAARNLGVAAARGDAVANLDADDLMVPERIERQLEAVAAGADVVLSREEYRLEDGVELPDWVTARRAPISDGRQVYSPMTFLASRAALERIGPFADMRYGEDTDWAMRAFEAGLNIVCLDEPLLIRRFHGGNATYDFEATRGALFSTMRARVARKRA